MLVVTLMLVHLLVMLETIHIVVLLHLLEITLTVVQVVEREITLTVVLQVLLVVTITTIKDQVTNQVHNLEVDLENGLAQMVMVLETLEITPIVCH
jgi:hypothetical protein